MNLSGPLSAHARKLTAMPFIMIVVTTSCAPVRTFRIPGTAANTIPPTIAAIRVADNRSGAGRKPRETSAHAATTIAKMYCPSTPMLNSPPLKQIATASAEKIKGVAIAST